MPSSPLDPELPSPSRAVVRDPQLFSLSWYGQALARVVELKGLVAVEPGTLAATTWRSLPGASSGHLVALSPRLLGAELVAPRTVVVGGPCIGDCSSFPTLEALYDSVQPLLAARTLGVPVLLFLGDQEEIMERGGPGRWLKLAQRMEGWLAGIADLLGVAPLYVVRTSTAAHRSAVEPCVERLRAIPPDRLDRAFHLASTSPRPQGEAGRDAARRVVAAHYPAVVAAHVPESGPQPNVLMIENLQQAGVWQVASEHCQGDEGRIEFAAHWPAPALSAGERMFRAPTTDKAPAWMLQAVADGDLAGVSPEASDFFATWLEPEQRRALAERARESWLNPPPA